MSEKDLKPGEREIYKELIKLSESESTSKSNTGDNGINGMDNTNSVTDDINSTSNTTDNSTTAKAVTREPGKPGRHKADCACPKCEAKRGNKPVQVQGNTNSPETAKPTLNKALEGFSQVELKDTQPWGGNANQPGGGNPGQVNLGKYISGALFVMVLDSLVPALLVKLMSYADPKYTRLNPKKIQMDAQQRKEFSELADEAVKQMFGYVNPVTALLIGMSLVYAGNLLMLDESDFKQRKKTILDE